MKHEIPGQRLEIVGVLRVDQQEGLRVDGCRLVDEIASAFGDCTEGRVVIRVIVERMES